MSKRTPLPTTTPTIVVPAPAKKLDDSAAGIDTAVAMDSSVNTVQEVKPAGGLPSPVPLFTLHAALLI